MGFIGKNSMSLYVIHAFDTVWYPFLTEVFSSTILVVLIRLMVDLLILFLFTFFMSRRTKREMQ